MLPGHHQLCLLPRPIRLPPGPAGREGEDVDGTRPQTATPPRTPIRPPGTSEAEGGGPSGGQSGGRGARGRGGGSDGRARARAAVPGPRAPPRPAPAARRAQAERAGRRSAAQRPGRGPARALAPPQPESGAPLPPAPVSPMGNLLGGVGVREPTTVEDCDSTWQTDSEPEPEEPGPGGGEGPGREPAQPPEPPEPPERAGGRPRASPAPERDAEAAGAEQVRGRGGLGPGWGGRCREGGGPGRLPARGAWAGAEQGASSSPRRPAAPGPRPARGGRPEPSAAGLGPERGRDEAVPPGRTQLGGVSSLPPQTGDGRRGGRNLPQNRGL